MHFARLVRQLTELLNKSNIRNKINNRNDDEEKIVGQLNCAYQDCLRAPAIC
jgi:hypothetical protein